MNGSEEKTCIENGDFQRQCGRMTEVRLLMITDSHFPPGQITHGS